MQLLSQGLVMQHQALPRQQQGLTLLQQAQLLVLALPMQQEAHLLVLRATSGVEAPLQTLVKADKKREKREEE